MDRLPQEICDQIAATLAEPLHEWKQQNGPEKRLPGQVPLPYASAHTPSLAPLAAVSRSWQRAVENQTFRHMIVQSTELDDFSALFVHACRRRRRVLRRLDFSVVLPPYSGGSEAKHRFEQEPDRQANDECFTEAVEGLFRILVGWKEEEDDDDGHDHHPGWLDLQLWGADSPDDVVERDASVLVAPWIGPGDLINGRFPLRNNRFRFSYLQLLRVNEWPAVSAVGALSVHALGKECYTHPELRRRNLSHRVGLDMMTRLPRLWDVYIAVKDTELHYPALRRLQRGQFAEQVQRALASTPLLRRFVLHAVEIEIRNHAWHPADLRPGAGGGADARADPVSTAIFAATAYHRSLRDLDLTGVFDESLFGVCATSIPRPPFWQNLRSLVVKTRMTTPSGHWNFRPLVSVAVGTRPESADHTQMPPGYGYTTEDQDHWAARRLEPPIRRAWERQRAFRFVPGEKGMVPFLRAFAQACLQIPGLFRGTVQTNIRTQTRIYESGREAICYPEDVWGVSYFAPGERLEGGGRHDPAYDEDLDRRRLFWEVKDWQPDKDLQAVFQAIGRERYGDDLVERRVNTLETVIRPLYFETGA